MPHSLFIFAINAPSFMRYRLKKVKENEYEKKESQTSQTVCQIFVQN